MRIIQAVGWYFPATMGGTETYVAGLTARLQHLGHDVEIVVPDADVRTVRSYVHDGATVHRFPIARPLSRREAQGRDRVRGSEWFAERVTATRPDVVHFHALLPGLGLSEVKAAKSAGARVIATTHASSLGYVCARGTMMRWGQALCDGQAGVHKCAACDLQNRGLPRWAARVAGLMPVGVGQALGRLPGKVGTGLGMTSTIAFNVRRQVDLIETLDRFVVLTRWAFDAAVRNGAAPQKLSLNRLGISGEFRRKPDPAIRPTGRPVRMGYLGRFDPIKGVFDLARAIAALPDDVALRVEFRGPIDTAEGRLVRRTLESMVGRDPRVSFLEPISPEMVPGYLGELDVMCCPSVCLEGGPTVALEAHAAGTPVVGTRIGGLAELVADGVNGRLVAPGDWRALSQAMVEIARDPQGTIDRWRSAIPPARTMDEVAADYLALYAA